MILELKIISDDPFLKDSVISFIKKENLGSYRNLALDYLLDEKNKQFDVLTSFEHKSIFGATYQSSFRDSVSIMDVTHTIYEIRIDNNNIYGSIKMLDTYSAKVIKEIPFEKMVLKPVYKRDGSISTFDIDINNDTY